MNIFNELASYVEEHWSLKNHDLTAFTNVATKALEQFAYSWPIQKLEAELREWLLANPKLPLQMSVHNEFGQPSITLFNNNRFVVDLYIWVDFDTSIHSHGFRGAFRLLHGESLQETFQVATLQNISEDIRLVDMSKVIHARLKKDDIQTIAPGFDLTHRVIHLENPTVTLCVKTINEPDLKQWTYLPTGLAIQKQSLSADLIKKVYFYQYLMSHNDNHSSQFLHSLLMGLNVSTQIHIYETVASGALDLTDDAIDSITEAIVTLHEGSKWWPPYEKAMLAGSNEIRFEEFQKPLERLVAHFKNCGYDLAEIQKLDNAPLGEINRLSLSFE